MNEILAGYKGTAPAKYSFTQEKVRSSTEINFTLGFGYTGPAATADGAGSYPQLQWTLPRKVLGIG